ncbi:MAG TPA: lipase family protein [Anaeromyxobacteraceae bacterium]|nr:lipase family protein [Anaeromyxobacteraceae bacterium]
MIVERIGGKTSGPPFPVHPNLLRALAAGAGKEAGPVERDGILAHVLATCAGYAYADLDTVATMMSRVGFDAEACVRVSRTVDAMFIYSTAFLLQSRCGRVVILCYRGTETMNLGNWLGDAGVESALLCAGEGFPPLRVHAGFNLNMRATWWTVIEELRRALRGGSLLHPDRPVEHRLEALYVAGHSLGGAMALLFALAVAGSAEHQNIASTLRAVYTYGQPMAACEPLPRWTDEVARKLVRHVIPRDPVPALPPAGWGSYLHIGQEFRLEEEGWRRAELPVTQLASAREIARSIVGALGPEKRRRSSRYSAAKHLPQRYLAALRPLGTITELGDWQG